MEKMLHGVWRKKPTKQSKRRRPMLAGLVKYLTADSHMHAPLLSPPSSRYLSASRALSFLDVGRKGGEGGGNKRRFFERAVEYLKSDPHLYGSLVDAEELGPEARAGPMRHIERVVIAVSRGIMLIEETQSRSEENRHPIPNLARTGQSINVQANKVKDKVSWDIQSARARGKQGGVITRSGKVAKGLTN
ncbi:hypothetical protein MLD38_007202 [Melastoma candidum]|uniref:Uncharacterized protein n=1 Tax=Melastoma candidum TaxID=119954 RepID=A0ACB9RRL4_9MYRT|nr:hypothetical protein MLD38_007202 [Melastoma candidum]